VELPAGAYTGTVAKAGFKSVPFQVDVGAKDLGKEILLVVSESAPAKAADKKGSGKKGDTPD